VKLTRGDKTDVIIVVAIAVAACLIGWFLIDGGERATRKNGEHLQLEKFSR
jgi:hypothetical protein